jgi:hypothetical protein
MLWRHHDHNSWNAADSATWIRKQISTSTKMFLCYELCHGFNFGEMLPPLSGFMQGQRGPATSSSEVILSSLSSTHFSLHSVAL